MQEQGCGHESIGVIYMNKQIEYVIAYIAILKAHSGYLPMDVAYPPDLIDMVLQDAEPRAIITTPEYVEKSGSRFGNIPYFVCGDRWQENLPPGRISPQRPPGMTWESLAYAVYSSGTTGKPKGILCPHRGSVLSYNYRSEKYPYFEGEKEAANVFLVWELLRPLLRGAHLYVVPDHLIYDVDQLPVFIETHKIDRMMFTPSLLDAVLSNPEVRPERLQTLKLIVYCGEVVTVALRNKCREMLPNCRLHNLYSISEAHDCTGSDLTDDGSLDLKRTFCPVGKLLPGAGVLVLDDNMDEVPPGVQGEIFITGPYLARGYLRRPELTAARFPVRNGVRMYRTGDWGYQIRDGELEICGRCDSMVKVRGYSIELLAVQKALQEIKDLVDDAIVVALGEAAATEKTLVAYIILPKDKQALPQNKLQKELRALLKRRLPFYMVPTYIEFMAGFPTAAIGKVDKKALPSLESIQEKQWQQTDSTPSTPAEHKVAEVFQKILSLKTSQLDVGEGFFDLGGNSLLTIPLLKELSATFDGRKVELNDIFAYPSIAELAAYLSKAASSNSDMNEPAVVRDLTLEVELYSAGTDGTTSMNTRAFWRHVEAQRHHRSSRMLLTGATGFLGSFALCELLRSTKTYVYCLVRVAAVGGAGMSPAHACRDRLVKTLQSFGLYTEDVEKAMEERCHVLVGDAGLENMGLEEDEYHYLSQHIDTVMHAAAVVNLLYPYDALVAGNVRGTSNVVSFCQLGKIKALHYVSSDAVFPVQGNGTPREERDSLSDGWKELHNGYGQSKWVAEQLVRKALDCGLPGVIYRCGNIAGHMTTGAWNPKDSILSIIRACLLAQAVPVVKDVELTFEATPVDFITKFIVSCTENIRVCTNKTFHLIQPNHMTMESLLEATRRVGYSNVKAVASIEEWINLVEMASEAAGMQPVTKETLLEICSLKGRVFSNDNVSAYLKKIRENGYSANPSPGMFLPPRYPLINATTLTRYLNKLTSIWKLLPPPESVDGELAPTTKILHMRVIVVTGAASAMGSAIALRLARDGARIAAFDSDGVKLEQLAKEASLSGGVVQPVVCDVCDTASVRAAVSFAECEFATSIWGLVNCASKMECELVTEGNAESWCQMLDVNCRSVVNATGAVMNSLTGGQEGRGGHIVNITSESGHYPYKGLAAFSASKHFVDAWSRGIRNELSPMGIGVTNIQLGCIRSELKMNFGADAERIFAQCGYEKQPTDAPSVSDVAEAVMYALTSTHNMRFNDITVSASSR